MSSTVPAVPTEGGISTVGDSQPPVTAPRTSNGHLNIDVPDAHEIRRNRCVLEGFTQCSKSHLWKLMMSFYDRKGVESWAQGIVPHFITCNTFISKSYAKTLHGFLNDCLRPGAAMPVDTNEPLYIVELGTGAGKFSYFMLKALEEMAAVCDFPFSKIVYVMTDFTEANFKFWQSHPALKPYFDSGRLDAGIFDAVNDSSIRLWKSGVVLSPGSLRNPLVVVANYLFDTLCHDIFQVSHGSLKEGLVSTGSDYPEEPDPLHPDIITRLQNEYYYNTVTRPVYYDAVEEEGDAEHLQFILDWYVQNYHDNSASILLPIGAMRALRRLARFSDGRMLVISGDKGNNHPDQFIGLSDPHIAVHGSFSLMVNYHAIGAWFTSHGGFALHNPQEEASLKVSTFVLAPSGLLDSRSSHAEYMGALLEQVDNERMRRFPHLQQAFVDHVDQFGPNDFFVMQKSLKEDIATPPLRTIIALLKLSDWDPDVFFKFRDTILNSASSCGPKLRNDLLRGIPRLWTHYYQLDTEKDVAFEIGRLYYGVRDYDRALFFYEESTRLIGEHHVTAHNQGLCHYSLGRLVVARELFARAYQMCPEYEKARSWVERVSQELEHHQMREERLIAQQQQQQQQQQAGQESVGLLLPAVQQLQLSAPDSEVEKPSNPL